MAIHTPAMTADKLTTTGTPSSNPRHAALSPPAPAPPGALLEYVAMCNALDENAMALLPPTAMEPLESASAGDSTPATDAAP